MARGDENGRGTQVAFEAGRRSALDCGWTSRASTLAKWRSLDSIMSGRRTTPRHEENRGAQVAFQASRHIGLDDEWTSKASTLSQCG